MIKKSSFTSDVWAVTETEYKLSELEKNATLFFLGNGYIGIRGGFEEIDQEHGASRKGTFINGFFESGPQVYGEKAYGFPDKKQAMLNLPDATGIRILIDGEEFSPATGRLVEYKRQLSLKEGLLYRDILWESPGGRRMRLEITRCVSMARQHIALISCRISGLKGVERLQIISTCGTAAASHDSNKDDPRTGAGFKHSPLECLEKKIEPNRAVVLQKTVNSGLLFSEVVSNSHCAELRALDSVTSEEQIDFYYEGRPVSKKNETFTLDKYICYFSSIEENQSDLIEKAVTEINRAEKAGTRLLLNEHVQEVGRFWEAADVEIEGDKLQQGIRFNLFSIYQSAGRDGRRNIAAKGLSGEGYEGHYFWDTEIYVIPFFSYTVPETAAKLLEYRYNILDKARARAKIMSEDGALFPWRTINGEEASAYFPAGTAQYHINADIAYGIKKYHSISGDGSFIKKYGLEILIETARLWMSLGFFQEPNGSFRINCVTGPDEYTAIVNNNYFTNIMAKSNLQYAAAMIKDIKTSSPSDYFRISKKTSLSDNEPELWNKAAEAMYLPYDKDLNVHAQDDSFLQKESWNFLDPKLNNHPLLLNLHPLVIYRYQILKQPDLVLAVFLQNEKFTRIEKMRDYNYYNPITTGDSSLAPCIQSIMAAELGRVDEAYEYFMKTARMDLDDINSNVCDGIHIAAMSGTWLSIIYGFAGLRDYGNELSFCPRLPSAWNSMSFKLKYRGNNLSVRIDHEKAVYTLIEGQILKICHMGSVHTIRSNAPVKISMKPQLKAVIFDLDGVITDTSEYHYQAWEKLSDEEDYTFSREINEQLRGIGRLESLDIILKNSGVVLSDKVRFKQGERKNRYYKQMLKSIGPDNILPGIKNFMSSLKEHKIKTALASASRNAPEVIEKLGIAGDFDVIMDAATVVKGKPDPEIFVTAAEALNVYPEQCAGVEDAEAGVEAIRAAGIFSIGIGEAAKAADWAIDSTGKLELDELLTIFGVQ